MSNTPFPFKVGDKVRRPHWDANRYVTVCFVNPDSFRGPHMTDPRIQVWAQAGEWVAA